MARPPPVAGGEWPALLTAMLATETLRPSFGRHPRLAIWGPLEARLQRADLLVLGGLNEGTWPPTVETGPWINRPMRAPRAAAARAPGRPVGARLRRGARRRARAADPRRARRRRTDRAVALAGAARRPVRLGSRKRAAPPEYIQRGRRTYVAWAEAFDDPHDYKPWPRPEPRPPVDARPTRLSVSSIEQWRRDPYGLYARQILRLQALDPLEEELGAAERGSACMPRSTSS